MPKYEAIVEAFLDGRAPDDKKVVVLFDRNRTREPSRGSRFAQGPLSAAVGTWRMSFTATQLLAYQRWPLAVRTKDGAILLNGDGGPTRMTRELQGIVRMVLGKRAVRRALVPFSALQTAEIRDLEAIRIVATTPDRRVPRRVTHRRPAGTYCYERNCRKVVGGETPDRYRVTETHEHVRLRPVHFLGETLLLARTGIVGTSRYYVCGLDRNDDPFRRRFYLARLSRSARPRTVEQALAALRPKGMPTAAPRQGEWFFVPAPRAKADEAEAAARRREATAKVYVPIVAADPAAQARQQSRAELAQRVKDHAGRQRRCWLIERVVESGAADPETRFWSGDKNAWTDVDEATRHTEDERALVALPASGCWYKLTLPWSPEPSDDRIRRHVAQRMYLDGQVFVRGRVTDADHDAVFLPSWHCVVRNAADGSWAVDPAGPMVD